MTTETHASETVTSILKRDLHWVSIFLRASIGSLFLAAALMKVPNGIAGTVGYYTQLFEKSLLPSALVQVHAASIMLVEFALAAWLFSGYRLSLAWKAAALVLVSLALGMVFAGKYDVASDNYGYVFLSLLGVLASPYDRFRFGEHTSSSYADSHERARRAAEGSGGASRQPGPLA